MAMTPPTNDDLAEIAGHYRLGLDAGDVESFPWDRARSAGGSSSGSAALVAAGHADMALGGDQGGSVRIPSAFCGTVGHKPTHGLVPYTGAFPIENTIDHLGPITRNVHDAALLLTVLAGRDGLDPRQRAEHLPSDFLTHLEAGAAGLRVAVVAEGFDVTGHPATSVPAGLADGLPVGMMIVGRHLADGTCLRVARAFENAVGGFPAPPGY
jgi:Asp-tRNA(Asn)/Glu-tRNA(Gln) amidotransferase A subunit family amidase